jgi:hypothetical protein
MVLAWLKFNFFDRHTKILLSAGASVIGVIDDGYKLTTYSLTSIIRAALRLGVLRSKSGSSKKADDGDDDDEEDEEEEDYEDEDDEAAAAVLDGDKYYSARRAARREKRELLRYLISKLAYCLEVLKSLSKRKHTATTTAASSGSAANKLVTSTKGVSET